MEKISSSSFCKFLFLLMPSKKYLIFLSYPVNVTDLSNLSFRCNIIFAIDQLTTSCYNTVSVLHLLHEANVT